MFIIDREQLKAYAPNFGNYNSCKTFSQTSLSSFLASPSDAMSSKATSHPDMRHMETMKQMKHTKNGSKSEKIQDRYPLG